MSSKNIVTSDDIDLERGFKWNPQTKKLWVDLSMLIDNDSLIINPQSGKLVVNPTTLNTLKDTLKNYTDDEINKLESILNNDIQDIENSLEDLIERINREGIRIFIKPNSGLTGNGTKDDPLGIQISGGGLKFDPQGNLVLNTGSGLVINPDGKIIIDASVASSEISKELAVNNSGFKLINGKLTVDTINLVDASGNTIIGKLVNK